MVSVVAIAQPGRPDRTFLPRWPPHHQWCANKPTDRSTTELTHTAITGMRSRSCLALSRSIYHEPMSFLGNAKRSGARMLGSVIDPRQLPHRIVGFWQSHQVPIWKSASLSATQKPRRQFKCDGKWFLSYRKTIFGVSTRSL